MRRRKSNGGGADGKTKGGPLFKVKTEAEKDKEFEDKCEKYCSRAIGLGILGWTMFNFIYSLGDYFFRSGMENIDTNVDLSGKVAVLTGGTSGIGFELAISMALAGAKVYVGAKNATLAESLQVELQARASELNFDVDTDIEKITSFPLRLDRFASVKKFARQVIVDTKKNGKGVNLLVNNAGTLGGGGRVLRHQGRAQPCSPSELPGPIPADPPSPAVAEEGGGWGEDRARDLRRGVERRHRGELLSRGWAQRRVLQTG